MKTHPNKDYVEYIIDGIQYGFDTHIQPSPELKGNRRPMPVTSDQEIAMLKWIKKGINMGYIDGPYKMGELDPSTYILSPFGAVTQKNKVRPIINYSSPKKSKKSINSHIDDKYKSVKYISLFEVVKLFHSLGPGAYVWAADLKDAYLIVPIKEKDHKLMAFQWK